jgi:hypothetical protein
MAICIPLFRINLNNNYSFNKNKHMKKIMILLVLGTLLSGTTFAQKPVPLINQSAKLSFSDYNRDLAAGISQVVIANLDISALNPVFATNDFKAAAGVSLVQDEASRCNCTQILEKALPLKERSQKPGRGNYR